MIQRIQSLWLFLASMISGALFIFPLFSYKTADGVMQIVKAQNGGYPLLLVAVVMTLLPLVAIFLFNKRPQQKGMTIMCMVACMTFLSLMLMRVSALKNGTPAIANIDYSIPGAVLPVISMIPLILAIIGIRKDEKLIKSLDRLR